MADIRRTRAFRPNGLEWPLTPHQVDGLNATIDDIYSRLTQAQDLGLPIATGTGDLLYLEAGVWSRLAIGTAGHMLRSDGTRPGWSNDGHSLLIDGSNIDQGTIPPARYAHTILSASHSDVTVASAVNGDLLIRDTTWKRLAIGAANTVLRVVASLPAWSLIVDAMVDAAAAIAWTKISKVGSSLADLATRSAGDLNSGTLADARLSTNVPLLNAAVNTFTQDMQINGFLDVGQDVNANFSINAGADVHADGSVNADGDVSALGQILAQGGQVVFPATQNPSSDANTLDDYEEGTWTPTLTGTGGSSGQVYSAQNGYYTKVGRDVTVYFRLALSTLGTVTGSAQIAGLPFTSANLTNLRAIATLNWANMTTALYVAEGQLVPNVTTLNILGLAAAGVSIGALVQGDFSNTSVIAGSLTYPASA